MRALKFRDPEAHPVGDQVIFLSNVTWDSYQGLVEARGESAVPKLAYLEGDLELMSPSLDHDVLKSLIGRLTEAWCLEYDVEFTPAGSWTLGKKKLKRGVEPDECYLIGPRRANPERPDLAIEVEWTRSAIRKEDIYSKLGVPELWIWRRGRVEIRVLRGASYHRAARSVVLPGIDLSEMTRFFDRPTVSRAIKDYVAALRGKRKAKR